MSKKEKEQQTSAATGAADASTAKIHAIVKYPDPVLSARGENVTEFGPELGQFVEEMWASMYAAHGIGLAAPQVGVSKRITVIDASFKERPDEKLVLINPEIIKREGKQFEEEGCLSLPEIRDKVHRAARVTVRAQDVNGEFFEADGEELLARAIQHEIDHLDGILFIDRLSPLKRDLAKRKIRKLQKNGEW
ncbi:MAG TPA: peptide deformylase [Rhizomicrobium sp.]|jgi:peptide deformylase|nr:peptide deformylase [Rhizomicrobium sp.]